MDFVDKALSNDNKTINYSNSNFMGNLESEFYDLKINANDKTENSVTTNYGCKLGNGFSNNHILNGHSNKNKSPFSPASSTQQFNLNNDLINESYEYAKTANEFKEKSNDVYTAIIYLTKAIELNPTEFRFYCNRSICLQQANRLNEALDDANSAINLNPNARKPYIRKAEILCLLSKYNEAENALNYCLRLKGATDIPIHVVQDEIQKLIKMVLTRCGISGTIVKQAAHCQTIEEGIDFAFSKQMEHKLSSQKFANNNGNTMLNNHLQSFVNNGKQRHPSLTISKSLDSQETIDYLTDEELNNLGTPNRKLSINEDFFNFNLQSPLRKETFSFNQIDKTRHFLQLNNYNNLNSNEHNTNLVQNSSSLANLNSQQFTNPMNKAISIPIQMNRKRNSISLCEALDSNYTAKSLSFDRFSNYLDTNSQINTAVRHLSGNSANENAYLDQQIYSKSLGSNLGFIQSSTSFSNSNRNYGAKDNEPNFSIEPIPLKYKEAIERANQATNLIGYKGLWLGNVSSGCSRERLISIFKKYGEPIVSSYF